MVNEFNNTSGLESCLYNLLIAVIKVIDIDFSHRQMKWKKCGLFKRREEYIGRLSMLDIFSF